MMLSEIMITGSPLPTCIHWILENNYTDEQRRQWPDCAEALVNWVVSVRYGIMSLKLDDIPCKLPSKERKKKTTTKNKKKKKKKKKKKQKKKKKKQQQQKKNKKKQKKQTWDIKFYFLEKISSIYRLLNLPRAY